MSNEWSMSKWHLTLTHLYSYPTLMTWQVSYRFSSPSPLSTAWIFVQPFLSPRPGCFPDDLTKSFPKTGSIKHWGGVWEIQNPWAFGTPTFLVSSSFIQTCELDWIREYVGLFSKVPWSELSVFKSEICTKLKKMFFFGLVGVVNCFNAFQITGPPKKNTCLSVGFPFPKLNNKIQGLHALATGRLGLATSFLGGLAPLGCTWGPTFRPQSRRSSLGMSIRSIRHGRFQIDSDTNSDIAHPWTPNPLNSPLMFFFIIFCSLNRLLVEGSGLCFSKMCWNKFLTAQKKIEPQTTLQTNPHRCICRTPYTRPIPPVRHTTPHHILPLLLTIAPPVLKAQLHWSDDQVWSYTSSPSLTS